MDPHGSEGRFRLKKVVGGVLHLAEVAVRAEQSAQDEVAVSDQIFDWYLRTYGPQAARGGPDDHALVAAAVAGVRYALERSGTTGCRLTVTEILDSLTDTSPDDVKFASVMAACQALDITLRPPPSIEPHGIVLPPAHP